MCGILKINFQIAIGQRKNANEIRKYIEIF